MCEGRAERAGTRRQQRDAYEPGSAQQTRALCIIPSHQTVVQGVPTAASILYR